MDSVQRGASSPFFIDYTLSLCLSRSLLLSYVAHSGPFFLQADLKMLEVMSKIFSQLLFYTIHLTFLVTSETSC